MEHKMLQAFIILITSHVMVSLMVVWLTETCQSINKGVWLNFSAFYLKQLYKTVKQLPEEATAQPFIKPGSVLLDIPNRDRSWRLSLAGLSNSPENTPTSVSELAGFKLQ